MQIKGSDLTLTLEERIYTLSYLWKEAEYNFAFWSMRPEIDWNAEYKKFLPFVMNAKSDLDYYLVLMRFMHCSVTVTPR